jgi:hypothetical protein
MVLSFVLPRVKPSITIFYYTCSDSEFDHCLEPVDEGLLDATLLDPSLMILTPSTMTTSLDSDASLEQTKDQTPPPPLVLSKRAPSGKRGKTYIFRIKIFIEVIVFTLYLKVLGHLLIKIKPI